MTDMDKIAESRARIAEAIAASEAAERMIIAAFATRIESGTQLLAALREAGTFATPASDGERA